MLNNYHTAFGWLEANAAGQVIRGLMLKRMYDNQLLHASKARPGVTHTIARTYRTRGVSHAQSAIGRVRCAMARVFPQFDHAIIGAIAKQIVKCARHVRLDCDNPNSHLAFSPGTIGAYDRKGRRSLTFAKFLRRKCAHILQGALTVSDAQLVNAQSAFQLVPSFPIALTLVTGQDAFNVYDDAEFGISSCMSGSPEKTVNVHHHFVANPDTLQLVTARIGKYLAIRAKLFRNLDGTYFLDRIYWRQIEALQSVNSQDELREWVSHWLTSKNLELSESCNCMLRHVQGEPMPYLDKCKQFDRNGDTIHIREDGDFCADNTDGTDESIGGQYCCCCCDCRMDEDDIRTTDYGSIYCESCYSDNFAWDDVNECDIPSEDAIYDAIQLRRGRQTEVTTHRDNCVELYDGRYALTDDAVELHDGQYALRDDNDIVYLGNGEYAMYEDCVHLADGEWALTDDAVELHDGQYALRDDAVETINGEWALADDVESFVDDYGNECYILAELCL